MRIGITYNLRDEVSPEAILDTEFCEEFDMPDTIDAVSKVLESKGHEVIKLGWGTDIIDRIKKERIDFVFNIAEGYRGRSRESQVPSVLEMLSIPYSGSDPLTLGLSLDKTVAKKIIYQAGIPTPRYHIVTSIDEVPYLENRLKFPLITKPAWEGSSKGIYNSSKVSNKKDLLKNIASLLEKYPSQPVLIEEYIEGREITVGVIGNNPPRILGIMEVINKAAPGEDFFYSLEVKRDWKALVDYEIPKDINTLMDKHIRHYAISAFKEFGCKDIARFDFRVSRDYNIYLLEVNPLPGLSPEYADLVIMSKKVGIEYDELILSILDHAVHRYSTISKDGKFAKME